MPLEIDNHADTHVFGANFRPILFTGQECNVRPFLDEYQEVSNIPIVTGATAWDSDEGETLILIFGQGLWFGNRIRKSLINPNQCRAYGVKLCDDPTDGHRKLGFQTQSAEVPLEMNGSICTTYTRSPTDNELEECT